MRNLAIKVDDVDITLEQILVDFIAARGMLKTILYTQAQILAKVEGRELEEVLAEVDEWRLRDLNSAVEDYGLLAVAERYRAEEEAANYSEDEDTPGDDDLPVRISPV